MWSGKKDGLVNETESNMLSLCSTDSVIIITVSFYFRQRSC